MNVKEYNWEKFTDRNMFEIKLSNIMPDFGYIPSKSRKRFIDFLVSKKFLIDSGPITVNAYIKTGNISNRRRFSDFSNRYIAVYPFQYIGMKSYRPGKVIVGERAYVVSQKSWKLIVVDVVND